MICKNFVIKIVHNFRCGNEDCLLEYDETTPSKLPSTPKRGSQIGDFGDGIFGSEFRTPTQNSLFGSHGSGSPMSRMGLEQVHEDTSVWATLVNELTKEWKNSGTPVAMLRYAKVHSCMKPGNKRHKHSETQQVTLSDLSKITCDTTALNTRYSESDIAGPLHSTMNDLDFSPIKEEKINHQVSHGSDHSLNTASSCSSLDPKEFKSGAWLTEESNIYQEIHPVSVDFPSYPENQVPHTSNNHYYSSLPSSRFELSGNSYQVKHGSKMESNGMPSQQFSVEATCNSVPDWDNLTVPTTDGSQQTQESIPSDRMSSLISSSYKESDAISDSSINESDLEALQPKFKKPVGRAKRAHRTRSDIVDSSGHSSDSKFALHAPMNSPNASGSTKRTISSDIIINNVKSNEKLPELAESSSINTTDNSSMLNHTRPDCIGKLMTPAYQPVVFRNTQYMNSDNDSGIGVRPPCVGCSETPLNINLQGRYITYESDEEDSGSDNENFDEDDIHHISGLGMRPDCLGKSMMEIKQLVTPQTTHVRRSIDTDSGVSQLGSPGKILPPEIPVQRNPRSRYARLRVGCMSSESDQSMYGDQIEVLESHIVQKGNKKSIVRRLRNFGHFFGRNRKSSVK